MAQQIIQCPKCRQQHTADVFRSGGNAVAIHADQCGYLTDNKAEVMKVLGMEELHAERVRNYEMPAEDY